MLLDFAHHEPVLVYFDPDRVTTPAEVCGTDSDADAGVWVPVTACAIAAQRQLPDGVPCPNTMTVNPPCPGCGRRTTMEPWQDATGSGWQCHAMDCLHHSQDGEYE
ncbi:hypothetical protein ACFPC0_10685 [Streptomyces andamanensis]|uniref:Uncharacterized protein n=1 Tax=Streptomyces andamanensis TaxID=1565035 RepID=A0ABV8TCC4_9ACTN